MKRQSLLKSTLCLLMALVCNVAWAAIEVSTSVGTPEHVYRIKSKNGYWMTSCTSLGAEGNSGVFAFFAAGDGAYKVYSVERQKWVSYFKATEYTNGRNRAILVDTQDEANAWKVTASGDYYLFAPYLSNGNVAGFYWNWFEGIGSNPSNNVTITVGFYNSNSDGGSLWTLSEVEGFDFTQIVDLNGTFTDQIGQAYSCTYKGVQGKTKPVVFGGGVATISDEAWNGNAYTAKISFPFMPSNAEVTNHVVISPYNGFNKKYYASGTDVKSNNGMDTSLPTDVKNYLWAFYPTFTDAGFKVKIKNVGTGAYIFSDLTAQAHETNSVSLKEVDEASSFMIIVDNQIINESGKYLSVPSSGAGTKDVGNYHKDHNGTKNKFVAANNYTLTLSDESTYSGTNGVHNVQGGNYTYTDGVWSENGYSAKVDFNFSSLPFPMSTVGAEDWTFIRCYMSGLETYFYTNGDNVKTKSSDSRNNNLYLPTNSVEAVNKYQWAIYYPTLIEGKFTFKIKNRATGKYLAGTKAGDATVADTGADFCWGTCMGNGSGFYLANNTNVFFAGNSSSQGEQKAILWNKSGTTHMGGNLSFTKEAYSITFDAIGYTTLYTPSAVTIPNGVTAYTGHLNATKSSLFLKEVSGATIPAQTAVVLKGTASTTYVFSAADGDLDAIANNDLKGASEVIDVADVEGVVYTFSDNAFAKVAEGDIEGYTAYFELPEGSKTTITLNEVGSVEDFVNGDVYTFVTPRGWIGGDDENDKVIGTVKPGVTVNPAASSENSYFQWVVYKSNNGNYYLYNLGKEKFLALQSDNIISFVENPTSKALTFKSSSSAEYPIMISPDNKGTVSQNANAGLFYWNSGLSNPGDEGNTHKVTKVKTLTIEELATIADLVNAYDKRLYVKTEVEGLPDGNPNTHYGSVIATNASASLYRVLKKANRDIAYLDYDGLKETTISFGREYRGFEFQGFKLGEQDLGKSFTLTEEQKASITAETPLVAKVKFNGTKDVTLFSDDDDYSYRIPAITTTGTGRIIAVSDYRHNLDDIGRDNHHTGTKRIDLVMRYSEDNGATWSEKQTIAEGSGNMNADGYDCAYGDAAIAAVGEKVLVMAAAGNVVFTGGSATSHNRTVRLFSENNGTTWTKEDISETLFIGEDATIKNGYSAFFGSGKLAVDTTFIGTPKQPRIYGAMLIRKSNGNYNNYAIYSDDFGLTWNILGSDDEAKQTPIASGDEPKMEILPNGQILLSVRRGGGRIFNVFTYGSSEEDKANGIGTWNGNENFNNGGADCNGETFCVDATKPDGTKTKLLLQSQPKGSGRTDVSIWYKEISAAADATHTSVDIAGNWTFGLQVSTQKSAYSAMTLQKDGKIGFFFEEAPCFGDDHTKGYCMVYIPLSIEEITGCSYYSTNVDPTESTTVNISLSDAQGNVYEFTKTSALNAIATTLTTAYPFITLGNNGDIEFDGTNYTYTNTVTLPFKVSNEENTYWHNIYFHTRGDNELVYLYADSANDSYVVKANGTANHPYGESQYNTLEKADNMSWAMYHVGNFTFKFKNKLTDKYVRVAGVVSSGNAQNVEYVNDVDAATAFSIEVDASNSWKGDYSLKATGEHIGYLSNTSTSVNYATNYSTNGHQGGWATIVEAPDFETLFAEVNAVLNMFGNGLGQYSGVSEEDLAAAKVEMETPNDLNLKVLKDYKALSTEAELNLPIVGQYFRIRGISGNYIDASSLYDASSGQMSMKSAETCNYTGTIFLLDEDNKLKNYHTGTYVRQTREIGADVNEAGVWTFAESPRKGGKYALSCTTTNNNGSHLHDSGDRADRCSSNCGERHDFILEEIEPTTVTIGNLGYSTLYSEVALSIPEGEVVTAYTGTLNETNEEITLTLNKVEGGTIPANTAVILKAKKDTYSFNITEKVLAIENNALRGTATDIFTSSVTDGVVYTLQPYTGGDDTYKLPVVFMQYADEDKPEEDLVLAAGKAYLVLPADENGEVTKSISIRFEGTTDIEHAEIRNQHSEIIYDLQGRRVLNPTKGIYIVNGKKIIK